MLYIYGCIYVYNIHVSAVYILLYVDLRNGIDDQSPFGIQYGCEFLSPVDSRHL